MFDRYSGFVRRFCRERSIRATRRPVARAFLAPGLRKAEPDSRTFRSPPDCILVLSPGGAVRLRMDTAPGGTSSLSLSFLSRFSARCRDCSPPGLSVRPDRKPSAADRSVVSRSDAESARNTGSCPVGRAAGLHPSRRLVDRRRRHPIPLGRIRQSYISLCGEHTRPGVAISPSRGLRLTDRVSDRFRPRGLCRRKKARARKPVRQGI